MTTTKRLRPSANDIAKAEFLNALADIYRNRDWRPMGYTSWSAYLTGEFPTMAPAMRTQLLGTTWIDDFKRDDDRTVYFLRADVEGGLVKIGVARDLQARVLNIQRMSPTPLRLIGAILGGGRELEMRLHDRFAAARRHGEWFEPVPELMAFIAEQPAHVAVAPKVTMPTPSGFDARFERELDEMGVTDPADRLRRKHSLRGAYFAGLQLASVRARRTEQVAA